MLILIRYIEWDFRIVKMRQDRLLHQQKYDFAELPRKPPKSTFFIRGVFFSKRIFEESNGIF